MVRCADAPRRPCAEASASRRPKDIWPPETRPQRGFRLELVGEKKKKAFKELLALNEARSSIYCSIVNVIWQQKMHHLRARGENQRN